MSRKLPITLICLLAGISFSIICSFNLKRSEAEGNGEKELNALDALQSMNLWRAYPNIDIPAGAYTNAWDFYVSHFKRAMNKNNFKGSWNSLGPDNVGGRTIGIALDPNDTGKIWIGSASGGLWKSTTGGLGASAWEYVPTGFPVQGVSSIAINPANSKVMYIGTGETYSYGTSTNGLIDRTTRGTFGIGILKSNDSGKTWHKSLDWSYQQNRGIWKIVVNPKNTNVIYAATTEGVYKSRDSGGHWVNVLSQKMVMDLIIDKKDTAVLYAGVGNLNSANKGIYQTSNSGGTWTVLTKGLPSNKRTGRISLRAYEKNNDIVVAHICDLYNSIGVYMTTDKGKNWKVIDNTDISSYQGWYANGILMRSDDSSRILCAGVDMFYKKSLLPADVFSDISIWYNPSVSNYLHSDIHNIIPNPRDPDKIYVINDGGLFRSNDFGTTYYECTGGYITSQFYIGSVSATDSSLALGGAQDNYTLKYDGMPSWSAPIGGDGSYNAIDQRNDSIQYGSYQYLNVIKSISRGSNFGTQILSTPANAHGGNAAGFLAPFVLAPGHSNIIYAGGDSLLRSLNTGTSFSVMGANLVDSGNYIMAIGVSYSKPDSIYFATAPVVKPRMKVFRSANGGKTRTDISKGLPNRFPRRIVVNPRNSREVYIVYSGFGTGHIFKSTDAGSTWADMSTGLPDVPFHCLLINPADTNMIFAGCDIGLLVSKDGGSNWTAFDEGLPDAPMIFDLVFSPSNSSLMAYTHGHGVYSRPLSDISRVLTEVNTTGNIKTSSLKVFPIPANESLNIETGDDKPDGDINIYSLDGKPVLHIDWGEIRNRHSLVIDIHSLRAGSYFLRTSVNGRPEGRKIQVIK